MKALVIGATGYVGSAISGALRAKGHEVIGTAQDAKEVAKLEARGDRAVKVDIRDPASVKAAADATDGAIYAVAFRGSPKDDPFAVERGALEALVSTFAGSQRPLVFTSGGWYYGSTQGRVVDESAPPNPPDIVITRPALEHIVRSAASQGVRGVVIRPGDAYGHGAGLPSLFFNSAQQLGAVRFIGTGENHWPVVHVDDLGDLFALAFAGAGAGEVFNCADATAYRVRDMAKAASLGAGLNGRTVSWPYEEARATLGMLTDALVLDQQLTSEHARSRLGWRPSRPTILEDLEHGSYATETAHAAAP
jgi:nucleoside-diphosphate-sugar epimerase